MFQFSSFRTRLLVFLVSLFGVVLSLVFFSVNQASISNAHRHLEEALQITASAFARTLQDREYILTDKVRLLSGDFAFKSAVATRDTATILSVLENHRQRVGANIMVLLSMDGELIADTLHPNGTTTPVDLAGLLEMAKSTNGEAAAIQIIDTLAYQMVVVPLYSPNASAWIAIGFIINDDFTQAQREFTYSEVSFLYRNQTLPWQMISSTLENAMAAQLGDVVVRSVPPSDEVFDLLLQGEEYLSLILDVQAGDAGEAIAILQRSVDEELAPYLRLRSIMLALFGLGLLASIMGAAMIARGISQPIELLVRTTRRIEKGDYSEGVQIQRNDEIGTLAGSVNSMIEGLAERDKVQTLLGKVVSREIADELLSKGLELGGEEREVTVLFSDIRNFTSLCEQQSASEMLDFLNRYLTRMSARVEAHGGVVDKYIGDAIMALFGAPIQYPDSPQSALKCAFDMLSELQSLNTSLLKEGQPPLAIGIGINTAKVVVGNMGSINRLNYTVIGDGVNLASRIEGLSKRYGVEIIVTQATKDECAGFSFRELDLVRVKGKEQPVAIFEPLASEDGLNARLLTTYHEALSLYRSKQWTKSKDIFNQLIRDDSESKLYNLYINRIDEFLASPPNGDWDGVYIYSQKQ